MARVFNIYFEFEEALHSAIVSVRSGGDRCNYVLGNLDADLRLQLPGTEILSSETGQFYFAGEADHHPKPLLKAITESLARHLQSPVFTHVG